MPDVSPTASIVEVSPSGEELKASSSSSSSSPKKSHFADPVNTPKISEEKDAIKDIKSPPVIIGRSPDERSLEKKSPKSSPLVSPDIVRSPPEKNSEPGKQPSPRTILSPLGPALTESKDGLPSAPLRASSMKLRRRSSDPADHLHAPSGPSSVPPLSPDLSSYKSDRGDSPIDASHRSSRRGSPYPRSNGSSSPKSKGKQRKKWKRGKLLGEGGFGEVYLGLDEDMGNLIAVKHVKIDSRANSDALVQLLNEVELMARLTHPSIVKYMSMETFEGYCNIFMEYVPGGSVLSVLEEFGPFTDEVTSSYSRQILNGLEYLHNAKVVHRDIKSANILLHSDGNLRLADFGAAVQLAACAEKKKHELGGTVMWMPPEVIKEGTKANIAWQQDIWSLGCTIMEMLTAKRPFKWVADDEKDIVLHIIDMEKEVQLPDSISKEASDFLLKCLKKPAEERPSATEMLTYKYIELSDANPVTERSRKPRPESPRASPKSVPRVKSRPAGTPSKRHSSPRGFDDDSRLRLVSASSFGKRSSIYAEGVDPGTPNTMIGSPAVSVASVNGSWTNGRRGRDTPSSTRHNPRATIYDGSFASDLDQSERRRVPSATVMQDFDLTAVEGETGLVLTDAMAVASVAPGSPADEAGLSAVVGWFLTRVADTAGRSHRSDRSSNERVVYSHPDKRDEIVQMLAECSVRMTFIVYKPGDEVEVLRSSAEWHVCTVRSVKPEEHRITIFGYESEKIFRKELSFSNLDTHLRVATKKSSSSSSPKLKIKEDNKDKEKDKKDDKKKPSEELDKDKKSDDADPDTQERPRLPDNAAKSASSDGRNSPEQSDIITGDDPSPLGQKSQHGNMSSLMLPLGVLQSREEEGNSSPSPVYTKSAGEQRQYTEFVKGKAVSPTAENIEWCSPTSAWPKSKVTPTMVPGMLAASPAGSPVFVRRSGSRVESDCEDRMERRLSQTMPQPNGENGMHPRNRSPHSMSFPRGNGVWSQPAIPARRESSFPEDLTPITSPVICINDDTRGFQLAKLTKASKPNRPILAAAMDRNQSASSTPKADDASASSPLSAAPSNTKEVATGGRRPRSKTTVTFSTTWQGSSSKRSPPDRMTEIADLQRQPSHTASAFDSHPARHPAAGTPITEHGIESNAESMRTRRSGSVHSTSGQSLLPISPLSISDLTVDRQPTGMLFRKRLIEQQALSPTEDYESTTPRDALEASGQLSGSLLVIDVRPEDHDEDSQRVVHSLLPNHNVALFVASLRTLCQLADVLCNDAERRKELHYSINARCEAINYPPFPALPSWLVASDKATDMCSQYKMSRPLTFSLTMGPPSSGKDVASDRVGIRWRRLGGPPQCAFIVDEVMEESPAEGARIVPGLELLCIDGKEVNDENQLRAALLKGVQRRGMVMCFYSPEEDGASAVRLISNNSMRSIASVGSVLIHTNSYGGSSSGSPLRRDARSNTTSPRGRTTRKESHLTQFESGCAADSSAAALARTGSCMSLSPTAGGKRVFSIEVKTPYEEKPIKTQSDEPDAPEASELPPALNGITTVYSDLGEKEKEQRRQDESVSGDAVWSPVQEVSRPPVHPLKLERVHSVKEESDRKVVVDIEQGNEKEKGKEKEGKKGKGLEGGVGEGTAPTLQERFIAHVRKKIPASNIVIGLLLVLVIVLLSLFFKVYYLLIFLLMLPFAFAC